MCRLRVFFVLAILAFVMSQTSYCSRESGGPSEDVLHYRKGRELYNLKDNFRENRLKAYDEFKKVVDTHPESRLAPEALYYMIRISELYRSPGETISLLRRMMDEFPHNNYQGEVTGKLADLLCQEAAAKIGAFRKTGDVKTMEEAIKQLREAHKVNPGFQGARDALRAAYSIRGDWYETKGETAAAIENYEQGLKDDPAWGYGHARLALLYEKAGEREVAIRHYEKAATYRREFPLCLALGRLCLKTGDFQKAARAFEDAVEAFPHSEDAYRGLAQAYMGVGALEKSEKALAQAEHIKKWGYADRGKHEQDVAGWLNLIENDPKPVYYYNLAALYESQGAKRKAYEYFNAYKGRAKSKDFKEEEKKHVRGLKEHMRALKLELKIREHQPKGSEAE